MFHIRESRLIQSSCHVDYNGLGDSHPGKHYSRFVKDTCKNFARARHCWWWSLLSSMARWRITSLALTLVVNISWTNLTFISDQRNHRHGWCVEVAGGGVDSPWLIAINTPRGCWHWKSWQNLGTWVSVPSKLYQSAILPWINSVRVKFKRKCGTKNPAIPHTTTPCGNVYLDRFRSGVLGGAGYIWHRER